MMKILCIAVSFCMPLIAQAESCYGPKLARDAIRAVALVSNRSMITDMVGGSGFDIWANYRNHGFSDHYHVVVDSKACRVLELRLVKAGEPIQNADTEQ